MKNCNTSENFITYAFNHWYQKKDTRQVLKLLKEFISSSIAVDKNFILTWIVSLRIEETTITFNPWKKFKKVKAYASDNILKLTKIKW